MSLNRRRAPPRPIRGAPATRDIVARMLCPRALVLAVISMATPALAGSRDGGDVPEDAFPTGDTRYLSRLLPPGSTDARLGVLADILLSKASGVLVIDRGLAPVGPGALALGLELSAGKCLLACGRISPDVVVDRWTFAPAARVTYHFTIEGSSPNLAATGFYALLMGGAALDVVDEQSASGQLHAFTYSPFVSAGLGTLYFPGNSDEIFAGGEVRATYMPRFTVLSLDPPLSSLQPQSVAPLPGVSLIFFMGVRL